MSKVARFAAYARNQLQCIIAFHLGETSDAHRNGEFALLAEVAGLCKTFADVGAHEGEWTAEFLRLSAAKGVLFEPGQVALSHLRERVSSGLVVVPLAVGRDEQVLATPHHVLASRRHVVARPSSAGRRR